MISVPLLSQHAAMSVKKPPQVWTAKEWAGNTLPLFDFETRSKPNGKPKFRATDAETVNSGQAETKLAWVSTELLFNR